MTKFIAIMGGVISSIGKGITTASIGKILKEYGYTVSVIKIDPYINIDAGTMRPTEHGEVWVTDDGGEIDQDFGTYERFLDQHVPKCNSITTGQIYKSVIDKERAGNYGGKTVQVIPHIKNEIVDRILEVAKNKDDFVLIEVGGVVGDIENTPFIFAIKSLESMFSREDILYVLVTYLPIPAHIKEMKTKPTQTAVQLLTQSGIIPDIIVCRAAEPLDDERKRKIESYVNIKREFIISAADAKSIYQIPISFENDGLGIKILNKMNLKPRKTPEWKKWNTLVDNIVGSASETVKIAIVGKYIKIGNFELNDVYVSINQALIHAGAHLNTKVEITWINSLELENNNYPVKNLEKFHGVLVPGGFGSSSIDGKIMAIKFARENNVPFLGICYGMQLAVVEYAQNVCGLKNAHTTEINKETPFPVIDKMLDQKDVKQLGGSMRLGAYPCILKNGTLVHKLYSQSNKIPNLSTNIIFERHRHRYEVNPDFINILEKNNMVFSGYHNSEVHSTKLMEFIELPDRTFFVATQAHPEFTSTLLNPNPLFYGFIEACTKFKN